MKRQPKASSWVMVVVRSDTKSWTCNPRKLYSIGFENDTSDNEMQTSSPHETQIENMLQIFNWSQILLVRQ